MAIRVHMFNHKTVAVLLFVGVYTVYVLTGFAIGGLENSTGEALTLSGLNASVVTDARPCDIGAGPWRPDLGVIDGQGCYAGGAWGNDAGVGCGYNDSPDEPFGFVMPYYLFTPTTTAGANMGGQPYFEWRRYNAYTLISLAAWIAVALPLVLLVCGRFDRKLTLFGSSFPVSHIGIVCWSAVLMVLLGAYVAEHALLNNLVGVWGRAVGGMAVGGFPLLLLFPAMRHIPLLDSVDRRIYLHRALAVFLIGATTLHGVMMAVAHVRVFRRGNISPDFDFCDGDHPGEFVGGMGWIDACWNGVLRLVKWDIGWPHGPPLAGLFAWVVMIVMGGVAYWFRRLHYSIFSLVHSSYVIIFALIWIHYPSTIFLSLPAVLAISFDHLFRWWTAKKADARLVKLETFYANDDQGNLPLAVRLHIRTSWHERAWPGSYVFVHAPSLGIVEHPFSISNCISGGDSSNGNGNGIDNHDSAGDGHRMNLEITIKPVGPWTQALAVAATANCNDDDGGVDAYSDRASLLGGRSPSSASASASLLPLISIDGPYCSTSGAIGRGMPASSRILLVAGGIGITPLAYAYAFSQINLASVVLVWSVRDVAMVAAFEPQFRHGTENCLGRECHVYVTRGGLGGGGGGGSDGGGGGGDDGGVVQKHAGRPDFARLMFEFTPDRVYGCGPEPMLVSLASACNERGVPLETDEFLF